VPDRFSLYESRDGRRGCRDGLVDLGKIDIVIAGVTRRAPGRLPLISRMLTE
jgi:hypothetical protein